MTKAHQFGRFGVSFFSARRGVALAAVAACLSACGGGGDGAVAPMSAPAEVSTVSGSVSLPNGVTLDGSGTIYVSARGIDSIVTVSASGAVSTVAGSGCSVTGCEGYTDSVNPRLAKFNQPAGLVFDATGNLLIAEQGNNVIREVAISSGVVGAVSTYAGTGAAAAPTDPSTLANATFSAPYSVARDAAGNLYVADAGNDVIRKIAGTTVTTLVASGLSNPQSVAVDAAGTTLYVSDAGHHAIKKFALSGGGATLTWVAGSGVVGSADGSGSSAQFDRPAGLVLDASGNLYVADSGNNLIRKVTSTGVVSTVAGNGVAGEVDGASTSAQFNQPTALALDAAHNCLYVTDFSGNSLRKIVLH